MSNTESPQQTATLAIDLALQQAIAHHQAGQWQNAENLYRSILHTQPNHPDANHNLGVLALQVKQPAASLPHLKAALEANPKQGQYWLSYIDALIQTSQCNAAQQVLAQGRQRGLQGEAVEALAGRLDRLENVTPDQPAEQERAIAHREAGRYKEASLVLQSWLVSNPQDASAYALLAQVLSLDKQDEPAWVALKMALSINPALPIVQRNHARLLLKQQKPDEALQLAQAAYQSDVTDPENQLLLAAAMGAKNQKEQALQLVASALRIRPNYAEAYAIRAQLKLRGNDLAGALADAEKTLLIKPHLGQLWGTVSSLRYQLKNLPGAIDALEKALDYEPVNVGLLVNLGEFKRQAGEVEAAIALLENAIAIAPDNASAWVNLGTALQESQRIPEAKAAYAKALEIAPEQAEVASNLGALAKQEGNWEEALRYINQALVYQPTRVAIIANRAATLNVLKRYDEAEQAARQVIAVEHTHTNAHLALYGALTGQKKYEDAWMVLQEALESSPKDVDILQAVANHHAKHKHWTEAEAWFRRALEIKPHFADAHSNLGITLKNMGRLGEAELSLRRALEIKPDFAKAHSNLGSTLRDLGRLDEAAASFRKAYQLGVYGAHIKEVFMIPAIMSTKQGVLKNRAVFEQNLNQLLENPVQIDDPLKDVETTNFYLAFHGLNDRDLQVKIAKFFEQSCPTLLYVASHCTEHKPASKKKIRVGFLSKFIYKHSVSLCYSRVVEELAQRDTFEVALISSHEINDEAVRKVYSDFAGERVHLPYHLAQARERVANLKLDILIYLDIGMEPLSYFMAFSRLAPVQCVLWGHPVTTGIGNMDYFLSAEVMESAGADEHYVEKLVRLPIGVFYFERPILPATFKTRGELGLPEDRNIYMCPMKLQKMHPDFDEAISRILQIDSNGVVVLFEDNKYPFWKTMLAKRFEETIPVEVRERIFFLPWINDYSDFISANAVANVVLDPFHFGIGSTAIAIFAVGTPIVTKPEEFLRGRIGMGYCKMMDLPECIAENTEAYARLAVEIATDQGLSQRIKAKILANNHVLYENLQPVDDLADFICSLTGYDLKHKESSTQRYH